MAELLDEHILIPFAPDWSFAVKSWRAHRASVAEGVTGLEERAAWFSRPKLRSQYTITAETVAGVFAIEAVLRQALESAKAAVPSWSRQQIIEQPAGYSMSLERSAACFRAGQWAGLARPFGDIVAAAKITNISGQAVTLDAAPDAEPGDLLVPLELGRIESVPSEVIGGGGRAFEIRFRGETPMQAVRAEFVFTEVDTESNWLSFLTNLYFLFFIDASGSMDEDIPHVAAAADELKALLRDMVYGGDQAKADHFVRVYNLSSERWLKWLYYTATSEEAARYVSLAFINEAEDSYHSVPRNPANEPTNAFASDYDDFQDEFARREYSRCKVYSINPTSSTWLGENIAFNEHLAAAVTGSENYASLGPALSTQYVFHETGIPSGREAEDYLADIFNLLGMR